MLSFKCNGKVLLEKTIDNDVLLEKIMASCVFLALLFLFLADCFVEYTTILKGSALLLGVVIFLYNLLFLKAFKTPYIFLFYSMILASVIGYLVSDNITLRLFLRIFFVDQPIAYFLLKQPSLRFKPLRNLALIIMGVLLYNWIFASNKYLIFPNTSRNYISVYLLFALFLLAIIYDFQRMRIPVKYMLFFLFFCIASTGRSNILIAFFLCIIYAIVCVFYNHNIRNNEKAKIFIGSLIFSIVIVVAGIVFFENLKAGLLNRFFSVSGEKSDIGRILIYELYVTKTLESPFFVLFGTDIKGISLLNHFNYNLHNSFFMMHKFFGMYGLLLVVFGLVIALIKLYKHKKWNLFIVLIAIVLRSLTDNCFPSHILNIPIQYLLFYTVCNVDSNSTTKTVIC